jgi:hypothetical protein
MDLVQIARSQLSVFHCSCSPGRCKRSVLRIRIRCWIGECEEAGVCHTRMCFDSACNHMADDNMGTKMELSV